MTNTKTTKRDFFNAIALMAQNAINTGEVFGDRDLTGADIAQFCADEIELLNRKNARKSDKPTKKQLENESMIEKIYEMLEAEKSYTVTDILNLYGDPAISINKMSALVTKMRNNVMLSREVVKGKAYFTKI